MKYDVTGEYDWFDPFSGQTYKVPRQTATQTLSPEQMEIRNQRVGAEANLAGLANEQSGKLRGILGTPFNLDGAPEAGSAGNLNAISLPGYKRLNSGPDLKTSYIDDFSADRYKVEQAQFARMAPGLEQDATRMDTRLANQGIKLGSPAYASGMKTTADARETARWGAILAGGTEQSRLAGLSRDQAMFGNDARQQMFTNTKDVTGFNNILADKDYQNDLGFKQTMFDARNAERNQYLTEQYASRNQPINEIAALLSGSQVTQPNFVNTKQQTIPTTDNAGIINQDFQNRMSIYNSQVQQQQSSNALFGNIIGSILGAGSKMYAGYAASDDELKKDKERIADITPEMGAWQFHYKGESSDAPLRLGLMASEVEKVAPEAVRREPNGYRSVNYGKALAIATGGL